MDYFFFAGAAGAAGFAAALPLAGSEIILDHRPAQAVADLRLGQVDLEAFGDAIGLRHHLDLAADDVQHAAGLQARAGVLIQEHHGDADADARTRRNALEIHMDGTVGYGVELHVAHDGALRRAVLHRHLEEVRLPAALGQFLHHVTGVQGDQRRLLLRPIDNCGDQSPTPGRARRPLTGTLARHGLDPNSLDHLPGSYCEMCVTPGDNRPNSNGRPPGVPARAGG